MEELDAILEDSFARIYSHLKQNPAELARRLARRRLPSLTRPPRATCVTLRANDTRLDESFHYVQPNEPRHRMTSCAYQRWYTRALLTGEIPARQSLTITKSLLQRLTEPVSFPDPVSTAVAARRLGVCEHALRRLTIPHPSDKLHPRNFLPKHIPAPAPQTPPLFHSLDTRGQLGILPWQTAAVAHARKMGWDLNSPQAIRYARSGRRLVSITPINPAQIFDPSARKIGAPSDPAFGPLWQHNASKIPEDFYQTIIRLRSDTISKPTGPRPSSQHRDEPDTRESRPVSTGWRFLCPQCQRLTRFLYLPTRLFALPDYLGLELNQPEQLDRLNAPQSLACDTCHRIDSAPLRNTLSSWGTFIAHITTGLLFGREVPKPSWLTQLTPKPLSAAGRQSRQTTRAANPTLHHRRDLILSLRAAGQSYQQIASQLGIQPKSVRTTYNRHKPPNAPKLPRAPRPKLHPTP